MDIGAQPIPDYGEKIPVDVFHESVRLGHYTDYDGVGYYATETEMTTLIVYLPDFRGVKIGDIHYTYRYVVWFNK